MHLTPHILRSTYDWMRGLPPFYRWKLPPGDSIRFRVTRKADEYGSVAGVNDDEYEIDVSCVKVGHTETLIKTMAHEMAHIRCDILGKGMTHGAAFTAAIKSICRHHGFDPKEL